MPAVRRWQGAILKGVIFMQAEALYSLSYGLYVIGVKNGDSFGGSVVDSFAQVGAGEVPCVMLSCMNHTNTKNLIDENGEFTVSVLAEDTDPAVIAAFGFQSSRDAEKWQDVPHTFADGLPVLTYAAAYLRCRVTDKKLLDTHTVFFCDVLGAWHGDGKPLLYADYQKPELKSAVRAAFEKIKAKKAGAEPAGQEKKEKWVCEVCGYEYDGEIPFEDLPEDYICPICGKGKSVFKKEE